MKFTIAICVLFGIIALSQSLPQKPESFKKGCTIDGYFVEAGSDITVPGKCEHVKCTGLNKVVTTACQEKTKEDKCFKKTPDLSKPFPDCCPQWICN